MPTYRLRSGIKDVAGTEAVASVLAHVAGLGLAASEFKFCDALSSAKMAASSEVEFVLDKELPKDQVEHLGLEEII